jgi:hypothetical protein
VETELVKEREAKVLVHCQMGVNRSPTVVRWTRGFFSMRERTHSLLLLTLVSLAQVIAYLVKYENYSLKDAVDRVRERCASLATTIVFCFWFFFVFVFVFVVFCRCSRAPGHVQTSDRVPAQALPGAAARARACVAKRRVDVLQGD